MGVYSAYVPKITYYTFRGNCIMVLPLNNNAISYSYKIHANIYFHEYYINIPNIL